MEIKTKICSKCGKRKHIKSFYKQRKSRDGFNTVCIKCIKKYVTQEWPQKRICPICKEEFEIHNHCAATQICCSRKCWLKYYYFKKREITEWPWPQKRNCLQCGKEFEVDYVSHAKLHCSRSCVQRYGYARHHNMNWPKKKECPICGKEFEIGRHTGQKVYCSRICKHKVFHLSKNPQIRKICFYCKEEFITTNRKKKYCSKKCSSKYNSVNRFCRPSRKLLAKGFPHHICQVCWNKTRLNFDPRSLEGFIFLENMRCPKCKTNYKDQ